MTAFIRKALREPLLHFVVAGFVLFVAGQAHRRETDPLRIIVTPEREAQLVNRYALQFGTPPDAATRAALVDREIEEEMLFRQGLALGLDRKDELVRRRVVQKMQFLLEDVSPPAEPVEAELRTFYSLHAGRYTTPARVTFSHVYFSSERGEEFARARALQTLKDLGTDGRHPEEPGDPFPDLSHFAAYDAKQVHRLFGPTEMTDAAFSAPPGRWVGPYESVYGWHLLYVDSRQDSERQTFAAVRDKVRTDYLLDAQDRANRQAMRQLAREFTVVRAKS
jgi:peptidyl-prolyl cis-trans isomerase C